MKQTLTTIFLLLCGILVHAQHRVVFEPKLTNTKIKNSLYNAIELIDSRGDSTLGFVRTGAFDRNAPVISKHPLQEVLTEILNSLVDGSAGKNKMLLHMRQFGFAEMTAAMSENGYVPFQADLYAQVDTKFKLIASVDTVLHLRSGIDVTNATLTAGQDTLTGFIRSALLMQPTGTMSYSYNDILHIDSIEKTKLKLYTVAKLNDGVYTSYNSFKNQVADKAVTVTGNYVYPGNVQALNDKGKLKDVKANNAYAIVYNGEPYIVTQYGFYPLKKVGNDFLFTGKATISQSTGSMIASSMFGLLGGLLAGSDNATFEMKIDHKNGSILRLKEIAEPKPAATNSTNWAE